MNVFVGVSAFVYFSNTVPLVCGIDASIKICMNSNTGNHTATSANICTHIFILILVLVLASVTLSASG